MYEVLQASLRLHKTEQGSLGLKEAANGRNNSKTKTETSKQAQKQVHRAGCTERKISYNETSLINIH